MAGVARPVSKTVAGSVAFTWHGAVAAMLFVAMAPVTFAVAQAPPTEPAAPASTTSTAESPPATTATPESAPAVTPDAPSAAPPVAPAVDYGSDRAAAYKAFREHFDARRFAEALPAAQQVVNITEQKYGKDSLEMLTPLMNLGTTKQRLADYNGAALQYQRALKLVETREGGFSRDIIRPLLGLGISYAAAGDYDSSARALRRAMDVSRKLDGLFNPQQLELVEPLVASYVALGQYEEAVREQQYALRLAESLYGRSDPRLLPALQHSAQWLETTGQYTTARQAYARALDIVRRAGGKDDLRMVTPLRGIARMYRMEYLYGSAPVGDPDGAPNAQVGSPVYSGPTPSSTPVSTALNDAGEDALELALEVLDKHPEEAVALRGETLVDLGDWYMIAGRTRDAMREYKEAWSALSAPGAAGTGILDTPIQLIYRPPSSGKRNPTVDPEEYTEHFVEAEFTVTPEGRAKDPKVVADDVSDPTSKSVLTSIKRSRYRPRYVDGGPVTTSGVRHRQVIFVRSS